MEKKLSIEGMTCNHCVGSVDKALRAVPGVTDVKVDLASKSAVVQAGDAVTDAALSDAVNDIGFDVVGIK